MSTCHTTKEVKMTEWEKKNSCPVCSSTANRMDPTVGGLLWCNKCNNAYDHGQQKLYMTKEDTWIKLHA
jgi:ribosomal protein L37AE/L43A